MAPWGTHDAEGFCVRLGWESARWEIEAFGKVGRALQKWHVCPSPVLFTALRKSKPQDIACRPLLQGRVGLGVGDAETLREIREKQTSS